MWCYSTVCFGKVLFMAWQPCWDNKIPTVHTSLPNTSLTKLLLTPFPGLGLEQHRQLSTAIQEQTIWAPRIQGSTLGIMSQNILLNPGLDKEFVPSALGKVYVSNNNVIFNGSLQHLTPTHQTLVQRTDGPTLRCNSLIGCRVLGAVCCSGRWVWALAARL